MACAFYQCVSYVPFLMDDPGELSLYIRERGAGPCGKSADASKCGILYRDYGAVQELFEVVWVKDYIRSVPL
jgi:hypothetical protein